MVLPLKEEQINFDETFFSVHERYIFIFLINSMDIIIWKDTTNGQASICGTKFQNETEEKLRGDGGGPFDSIDPHKFLKPSTFNVSRNYILLSIISLDLSSSSGLLPRYFRATIESKTVSARLN